jgi:TonB family protein
MRGRVRAEFVVAADGNVNGDSVRILESDHPALAEEVVRFLGVARFVPGTLDGGSVDVSIQFVFRFGT